MSGHADGHDYIYCNRCGAHVRADLPLPRWRCMNRRTGALEGEHNWLACSANTFVEAQS